MAEAIFTFRVTAKPYNYELVKYDQEIEGNRLDVTYNTVSYDEIIRITSINVYRPLVIGAIVPTAVGSAGSRGLLTEKSLQIPYNSIDMEGSCKQYGRTILPTIRVGQTATLILRGLDESNVTNLRISECELIIDGQSYIVKPTAYSDNRITRATCNTGPVAIARGGKRKSLRKRKSIKKLRKQSYRRRR